MKMNRIARLGLAGILGIAGAEGCVNRNTNDFSSKVPDTYGSLVHLDDAQRYVFEASSKKGIKAVFLEKEGKTYCLEPSHISTFPLGKTEVEGWYGELPSEIKIGNYEMFIVTEENKVVRTGDFEIK
jgi:hypothetical protein